MLNNVEEDETNRFENHFHWEFSMKYLLNEILIWDIDRSINPKKINHRNYFQEVLEEVEG